MKCFLRNCEYYHEGLTDTLCDDHLNMTMLDLTSWLVSYSVKGDVKNCFGCSPEKRCGECIECVKPREVVVCSNKDCQDYYHLTNKLCPICRVIDDSIKACERGEGISYELPPPKESNPTPLKKVTVPLGKITFECNLNGTVEVTLVTDGDNVLIDTAMKLKPGAMSVDKDRNARLEQSPIFSMYIDMMEARKAKGEKRE